GRSDQRQPLDRMIQAPLLESVLEPCETGSCHIRFACRCSKLPRMPRTPSATGTWLSFVYPVSLNETLRRETAAATSPLSGMLLLYDRCSSCDRCPEPGSGC